MKHSDIIKELKSVTRLPTNSQIARFLGVTAARVSQLTARRSTITARQIAHLLRKTVSKQRAVALKEAVRPLIELYPIDRVSTRRAQKWQVLPCDSRANVRNFRIKEYLEAAKGVYFFYNSQGEILYTGKTEKQTLWKELNLAFNRERASHKAFIVAHPITGTNFQPAWKKLRQPRKKTIYLYEVARFFSAYEVSAELISHLEALVVRSICNDMSNVKMEKFKF